MFSINIMHYVCEAKYYIFKTEYRYLHCSFQIKICGKNNIFYCCLLLTDKSSDKWAVFQFSFHYDEKVHQGHSSFMTPLTCVEAHQDNYFNKRSLLFLSLKLKINHSILPWCMKTLCWTKMVNVIINLSSRAVGIYCTDVKQDVGVAFCALPICSNLLTWFTGGYLTLVMEQEMWHMGQYMLCC